MTQHPCDLLDGYLGRWLEESEHTVFQVHLANCTECRQAVREQEAINRLLVDGQPSVPVSLFYGLESGIRTARRWRAVTWGVGMAASLLLALLGLNRLTRNIDSDERVSVVEATETSPKLETSPSVRVTFPFSAEVIAMPQKTENPGVTIIWVYPVVQTAVQPNTSADEPVSNSERSES